MASQRFGQPAANNFGACMESQPPSMRARGGPRPSDPFPFTFARPAAGARHRQSMQLGKGGGWASESSEESDEGWTDDDFVAGGEEAMEGVETAGGNGRVEPPASRASRILRDFKQMPIANEPTEDLVAFQTTYGNSLDKSKQILGLMGEKNRDALAAQMIEYESRRSKTLDLFEEQRYKLVGDVAVADYKKAADLIASLDSLASQAVQNRQQTKRDLDQIRVHTSARLDSLTKQYEARAKEFEVVMGELSAKSSQQGLGAKGAKGKGRGRK